MTRIMSGTSDWRFLANYYLYSEDLFKTMNDDTRKKFDEKLAKYSKPVEC